MFGLNEALMSFIRRQVGLRTDAADAGGSLHAKTRELKDYVGSYFTFKGAIASNTLRTSADAEIVNTSKPSDYVLAKSIQIFTKGTVRVSFDLRNTTYNEFALASIYINGSARGSERHVYTGVYTTFTEDFVVNEGDAVQLMIKCPYDTVYCRNFRIYYDYRTYDNIVIKN